MRIAAVYSFNRGKEEVTHRYAELMTEVNDVIKRVNASKHLTKKSIEKTMPGRMLYSPKSLNKAFKKAFDRHGDWTTIRVPCDYPTQYYVADYIAVDPARGAFREMDFVKKKLGIEVQFGKYAFMVYNVCAKMTIFSNLGHIDCGIEIVPCKAFANQMSTGVSYELLSKVVDGGFQAAASWGLIPSMNWVP